MARVSAVTVTWDSAGVIGGCLGSLLASGEVAEVVVVDNASEDGTPELIKDRYPSVRLVQNGENRGFAAGANQGIKAASGEYVLLVNPDISFGKGFVSGLAAALDADPEAGSAAPKLVRPAGGTIDSAGLVMARTRKAVDIGRETMDTGQYDRPCRVFGPCGAAAMLRRAMLDDVAVDGEYFDEEFFAYKEDVDLAWRANLMGWHALYVPGAVAVHDRGWKQSGRKGMPRLIRRISHRNRYLTIVKNDDLVNFLMDLPFIVFYELKLFLFALFFEPFLFGAWPELVRLMPRALAKRRDVMARRRAGAKQIRATFRGVS